MGGGERDADKRTNTRSSCRVSFSLASEERGVFQTRIVRLQTEEALEMMRVFECMEADRKKE